MVGGGPASGADSASARGDALFLAAALLWPVFSLALRGSSLGPWVAAALLNIWSALLLLLWLPVTAAQWLPLLAAASPRTLMWAAVGQGLVAGVLGLWMFAVAVQRLGAAGAVSRRARWPTRWLRGGWQTARFASPRTARSRS